MRPSNLIVALLLTVTAGLFSYPARAQEPGTALITECKSGDSVPGYKHRGFAIRAYAHFACGSSVYVWNASAKTALVQQDSTVAYIASKYLFGTGESKAASPVAVRVFLQGIAESLQRGDASAIVARRQLVRSCLATRGCRVEGWSRLAWTRIKQPSQLVESPDSTLRLFAQGIYYSALIVNPPVRFKDRPVPSLKSPVLLLDGGGLSLAVVDNACYSLGADGKWAAAGASAVQSAAAIQR
jgi:hypothetical protein